MRRSLLSHTHHTHTHPHPQNLPNFVKGSSVVGACTYQSHAARAFHNDEDEAAAAGGAVHDPSLVALVRTHYRSRAPIVDINGSTQTLTRHHHTHSHTDGRRRGRGWRA